MPGWLDYWAKADAQGQAAPFHRLAYHSLDVAAICAELLEHHPQLPRTLARLSSYSEDGLRSVLPYLVALHDLGKFSEPFQDLRPELVAALQGAREPRTYSVRHETAGYLLWRAWSALSPDHREVGLLGEVHGVVAAGQPLGRQDVGDILQSWMAAVLGHHGRPPEEGTLPLGVFKAHPRKPLARSREDAAGFARAVKALLAPGRLDSPLEVEDLIEHSKRSSWWVAGLAILCDWLGSDADRFPFCSAEMELGEYWPLARAAAKRAVHCSGLFQARARPYLGISGLFPGLADHPSPLQQATDEVRLGDGPQLFILEDLTGSGKTEAALVLASRLMASERAEGLFFALPTMATANAMDGRIAPLAQSLLDGSPSYQLSHSGLRPQALGRLAIGGAARGEGYGRGEAQPASVAASAWLADSRKKALLADLGVGTVDQAMLAALQSRHAALRLLGLHRKVLIVDEVHACDTYMLRILRALLEVHAGLGGSAILLSATLPTSQRGALASAFAKGLGQHLREPPRSGAYPLLTRVGRGQLEERAVDARAASARRVGLRWHDTVEAVVACIVGAARAGQCVCWVRNSVADALEAYELASAALGPEAVTLFHARFALRDRLRIEKQVLACFGLAGAESQRRGRVVIATQVVEQSLDLDFDAMVTDLCPIDLVIQRAGRLQRHPNAHPGRPAPVLGVLAPRWSPDPPSGWLGGPFRRTAMVYGDPGVLWRTSRELRERGGLDLPSDARALVDAVFDGEEVPESLAARAAAAEGRGLAQDSVAQNAVIRLASGYLREGVEWSDEASTPTRLGEPTTTLRLVRLVDGEAKWWSGEGEPAHRWQLSQLSVARRLVAKAGPEDEPIVAALERDLPFIADDSVTVVLREGELGVWQGRAIAERWTGGRPAEVPVRLTYSESKGLGVHEGN